MTFTESIRIALRALLSNKLRAVLTMLGIIIGVAAVITLMSVGKGVEAFVQESFQGLGSNLLFVFPGSMESSSSTTRPELTMGDYRAISDPFLVPDASQVAPEVTSRFSVIAGKNDIRTDIAGVTPEYQRAITKQIVSERSRAAAAYLKRFYDIDWADPTLYHLVINADKWGIDAAAHLIVNAVSYLPPTQSLEPQ